MEDSSIKIFYSNYNLSSMINNFTCYKNPDTHACIGLILADCPGSFQISCVLETDLSTFDKMIITVLKSSYWKIAVKVINYWDYKSFSNESFRKSLRENFKGKLLENFVKNFSSFINICNTELDRQLFKKKK